MARRQSPPPNVAWLDKPASRGPLSSSPASARAVAGSEAGRRCAAADTERTQAWPPAAMGKTPGPLTRQNYAGDPAPAGHLVPEVGPDLGRVDADRHRQRQPEAVSDDGLALLGHVTGVEQAEVRPVRRASLSVKSPGPLALLVQDGQPRRGFGSQVQRAE